MLRTNLAQSLPAPSPDRIASQLPERFAASESPASLHSSLLANARPPAQSSTERSELRRVRLPSEPRGQTSRLSTGLFQASNRAATQAWRVRLLRGWLTRHSLASG